MISNRQAKLITSLKLKKYREKHGFFVAEGPKVISELLDEGLNLKWMYTSDSSLISGDNHFAISDSDLKKVSFLKTPNTSLAVFEIPKVEALPNAGLIVAVDALRDPGNLGTIIRLCDWFGVKHLVCSSDTVDCYNPKVVQASMGSLGRVQIHYVSLVDFLSDADLPVYGGFMDGVRVYDAQLPEHGILVVGNEANGISETVEATVSHRISIPRFGPLQRTESLNVATATAILLSEFRRATGKLS